jgi:hypothetical protein
MPGVHAGQGLDHRGRRGRRTSRPVRRVLWPGRLAALPRSAAIHLGPPSPAGSCGLPAGIGRAALERLRRPCCRGPCDLAPGGVYRAVPVTRGAGGLLHRRFTLTRSRSDRAVCSLWHCPAGHPGLPLATTLPCGARTFLGAGVSPGDATAWPARPPYCRSYPVPGCRGGGPHHPGNSRSGEDGYVRHLRVALVGRVVGGVRVVGAVGHLGGLEDQRGDRRDHQVDQYGEEARVDRPGGVESEV